MEKLVLRYIEKLLPTSTRLARSRARITRGYAKELSAARKAKDKGLVATLRGEQHFELQLQSENEDSYLTQGLLRKAHRLRVPIPEHEDDNGYPTQYWYQGEQTGGWYFTAAGVKSVRDEIRIELQARRQSRAQIVVWLSAITGLVGAITGLVAVLSRQHG